MSSNNLHTTINRSNYEEAFLLYLDGELTPEQQEAVEAFIALHPDLGAELDVLLTTKLDSETILFKDKETLFSHQIKAAAIDEALLLYIDAELPLQEAERVAERIKSDNDYSEQHRQLKTAKLDTSETIPYPYKKELYRTSDDKVRPLFWLRIAVAAVLVLSGGAFWLTNTNKQITAPPVASNPPKVINKTATSESSTSINANAQPKNEPPLVTQSLPSSTAKQTAVALTRPATAKTPLATQKAISNKELLPQTDKKSMATTKPSAIHATVEERGIIATVTPQQTINTPTVTTTTPPAYTTIDATAAETGLSYAVASNNNEKKGSVRGFLRKATRFIERRTGINPVNEDDELLIGVVAIKL